VRLYLQAPPWHFRHSPPLSVYPVKGKREGSRARAHLSACVSACCACDCVCNLCGLAWSVLVSSQWSTASRCLFVVLSSLVSRSSAVTSLCSTYENENPGNAEITRKFTCCVDWILLGAREYGRIRDESDLLEMGAPRRVKNFDALSRQIIFHSHFISPWCSSALIFEHRIWLDELICHFYSAFLLGTWSIRRYSPCQCHAAIFSLLSAREWD